MTPRQGVGGTRCAHDCICRAAPSSEAQRMLSCHSLSWRWPACDEDECVHVWVCGVVHAYHGVHTPNTQSRSSPAHQHVPPRQHSRQRLRLNRRRLRKAGLGNGSQHGLVKPTLGKRLHGLGRVKAGDSHTQRLSVEKNLCSSHRSELEGFLWWSQWAIHRYIQCADISTLRTRLARCVTLRHAASRCACCITANTTRPPRERCASTRHPRTSYNALANGA